MVLLFQCEAHSVMLGDFHPPERKFTRIISFPHFTKCQAEREEADLKSSVSSMLGLWLPSTWGRIASFRLRNTCLWFVFVIYIRGPQPFSTCRHLWTSGTIWRVPQEPQNDNYGAYLTFSTGVVIIVLTAATAMFLGICTAS